jgi:hypothetical protein
MLHKYTIHHTLLCTARHYLIVSFLSSSTFMPTLLLFYYILLSHFLPLISPSYFFLLFLPLISPSYFLLLLPLLFKVINLGNGRPFSLKDFISLVETCVGKKARIQVFKKRAHNFNYLQKIS